MHAAGVGADVSGVPVSRRAINPLCTDVPLLEAGWGEGRAMALSLFAPSASPQGKLTASNLQPDEGTPALTQAA